MRWLFWSCTKRCAPFSVHHKCGSSLLGQISSLQFRSLPDPHPKMGSGVTSTHLPAQPLSARQSPMCSRVLNPFQHGFWRMAAKSVPFGCCTLVHTTEGVYQPMYTLYFISGYSFQGSASNTSVNLQMPEKDCQKHSANYIDHHYWRFPFHVPPLDRSMGQL